MLVGVAVGALPVIAGMEVSDGREAVVTVGGSAVAVGGMDVGDEMVCDKRVFWLVEVAAIVEVEVDKLQETENARKINAGTIRYRMVGFTIEFSIWDSEWPMVMRSCSSRAQDLASDS